MEVSRDGRLPQRKLSVYDYNIVVAAEYVK